MKKTLSILLLISTLILCFASCQDPDTNTNAPGPSGEMKTIFVPTKITNSYDTKDFVYNESGILTGIDSDLYQCDANGRLIKIIYETYYKEFTYDSNGRIIKETNKELGTDEIEMYFTYDYDAQGRMITSKMYPGPTAPYAQVRDEYVYGNDGKLIEINEFDVKYDSDWNMTGEYGFSYKTEFTYDAAGNLIKETSYQPSLPDVKHIIEYSYDASGKLIQKSIDVYGGYIDIYTHTYDSNGNVTKIVITSGYSEKQYIITFEYKSVTVPSVAAEWMMREFEDFYKSGL